MTLSETQKEQYHAQGFTLLGPVLDAETLAMFRSEEARLRAAAPTNDLTVFLSQVAAYSEGVRQFVVNGPCVSVAQSLIEADAIALWFNQFVTKMPDANSGKSEFPWHQDNGYVSIDPATNVTIWIALDDVDEQNGCVWVMPESHLRGRLPHAQQNGGWHLEVPAQGRGIPAPLRAGEAIAFTGLTLHRSLLNHTDRPRRAFFIEYCDAAATYQDYPDTSDVRVPVIESGDSWLVSGHLPWPPAKRE